MRIGNGADQNYGFQSMQAGKTNHQDGQTKNIQKQINSAQEQLRKLNDNKELSIEQKVEARKELQQQIQDLNKQLNLRQIEMRQEEQEKRAQKAQEQAEKNAPKQEAAEKGAVRNSTIQSIISADSSMKQVNTGQAVKKQLEGKAGVLEVEIKLDAARGNPTVGKEKELAEIEDQVNKVTSNMMSQLADLNEELKNADEEAEEAKKPEASEDNEKNGKINKEKDEKGEEIHKDTGEKISHLSGNEKADSVEDGNTTEGTIETYIPIDIKL